MSGLDLRRGGAGDVDAVLGLFDANVAWLVSQGREGQWGSEPWSGDPARRTFVEGMLGRGELWRAESDGRLAGVLIVGRVAPAYVEPLDEPELYVHLLIADPRLRGAGVGSQLLAHARTLAGEQGIGVLRVDCWAGGDGKLVGYYTGQGFTPTSTFGADGFVGQVLERRLS